MASAMTGRMPRSQTSFIRCQVISCSRIQSKTAGGGQYPRRPTCTKLRPRIAPDSMSRRVEVQQPYLAPAVLAGDGRRGGVGDRMVTADHHRKGVRLQYVGDLGLDVAVGAVRLAVRAVRVAGVDDIQPVEDVQAEIEVVRAWVVGGGPDGPRAEAGTRPVGRVDVQRGAHDRGIGTALRQVRRGRDPVPGAEG